MNKKSRLILLIIWLGVIYFFSSQNGNSSASLSSTILLNIAKLLQVQDIDNFIKVYHILFRKFAHVSEYFVLGILMFRYLELRLSNIALYLYTFILCVICASLDEIHQLFVSLRGGSFTDVLIDSIGIVLSLLIIYTFRNVTKRKSN